MMQKSEMVLTANEREWTRFTLGALVVRPALTKYRKHPCLRGKLRIAFDFGCFPWLRSNLWTAAHLCRFKISSANLDSFQRPINFQAVPNANLKRSRGFALQRLLCNQIKSQKCRSGDHSTGGQAGAPRGVTSPQPRLFYRLVHEKTAFFRP